MSEDVIAQEREELAPVRAAIVVERERARTFEVFVGRLGAWWPTRGHSMGEDRIVDIRMDRYVGGQVVEEHRGWASLGDDAAEVREGYSTGWPLVLAAFRDAG